MHDQQFDEILTKLAEVEHEDLIDLTIVDILRNEVLTPDQQIALIKKYYMMGNLPLSPKPKVHNPVPDTSALTKRLIREHYPELEHRLNGD
jgi:hypothetical protein